MPGGINRKFLLLPSRSIELLADFSTSKAPPSVIASWPKPNYVDPETEGPALMIVGIVSSAIAILLVLARMYSRYFITRAPGIDDLLIIISLVRGQPVFGGSAY
jgi:hypothetical protein